MAPAETAGTADPAAQDNPKPRGKWAIEPSRAELLLLVFMTGTLFISVMIAFRRFLATVEGSGDNLAFISIATAIRHWDFRGLVIKAFWGLPYLMAAVSFVAHISERDALMVVSYLSGLVVMVVAYRLWGGWVAGFFAVLNFDWMQRLFLGGSEPLFMALLLGAFLAARKERWVLAALLAGLATIVRPVGIFALVAIGLTLLWKRDFGKLALATLTGAVIGGLYVLPLALYFKNPMANVHRYQQADWEGGRLLTYPFAAIVKSTFSYPGPITNMILTWGWILFVLAGFLALLLTRGCREYWKSRTVEMLFAVGYLIFVFTYNSPHWIRGSFPRFAIPVLPFILLALQKWLPKDRRFLWAVGAMAAVLAAFSAIGIRNVAEILRQSLG